MINREKSTWLQNFSDSEKYLGTYILNGRLIRRQFTEIGNFGPCHASVYLLVQLIIVLLM